MPWSIDQPATAWWTRGAPAQGRRWPWVLLALLPCPPAIAEDHDARIEAAWEADGEPRIRLHLDDIRLREWTLDVTLCTGGSALTWRQPVEVPGGDRLDVPLTLPDEPVLSTESPSILTVEISALDGSGNKLAGTAAEPRQVHWVPEARLRPPATGTSPCSPAPAQDSPKGTAPADPSD